MNRVRLFLFVLFFAPTVAIADDFAPPPWLRSNPFAVTAEWEFLTPPPPPPPPNPFAPDGPLTNVFTKGTGTPPGGTFVEIGGPGVGWGGTSGGNIFFPGPGSMHFRVNNVVDTRPIKFLHVQVTSTPGMFLAIDTMTAFNIGATGSTTGPVSASSFGIVTGPFGPVEHTLFTWNMFPNPPWEDFTLIIGGPGEIRQVVVDTLSAVPEASTVVSYTLIFTTLGLIVWKRPKFWRVALG